MPNYQLQRLKNEAIAERINEIAEEINCYSPAKIEQIVKETFSEKRAVMRRLFRDMCYDLSCCVLLKIDYYNLGGRDVSEDHDDFNKLRLFSIYLVQNGIEVLPLI